jgi:hypothetical protein
MKKTTLFSILLILVITLASCVELDITEIDDLKVNNLNVTEYFLLDEIDLTNVEVEAYKDEQLIETVGLSDVVYTLKDPDDLSVTLTGNTFVPNKLGDYHLIVTYSDVSVSLKFFIGGEDGKILNTTSQVYYDDIQTAIDSASEHDVIYIGAGTYASFENSIMLLTPGITLTTNPYTPAALLVNADSSFDAVLDIRAPGVTVENLKIERNNATSGGQAVAVRHSNVTLRNLDISSTVSGNFAITVDHGWPGPDEDGYGDGGAYSLDIENVLIENNTISGSFLSAINVRVPGDYTPTPGSITNVQILGNSIHDSSQTGIRIGVFSDTDPSNNITGITILDNAFFDMGDYHILYEKQRNADDTISYYDLDWDTVLSDNTFDVEVEPSVVDDPSFSNLWDPDNWGHVLESIIPVTS